MDNAITIDTMIDNDERKPRDKQSVKKELTTERSDKVLYRRLKQDTRTTFRAVSVTKNLV